MKQVNIYTYSTAKSPKATKCEAVGYVIETETTKGDATVGALLTVKDTTKYQAELYVLKKALTRINTKCELHLYIECDYIAAGFGKWLTEWKENGWQTKRGEAVKNSKEWQELDALVQQYGHTLVFHVKEKHSYRNWFIDNLEKEKQKCLKNLENSIQRKK